MKQYQTYTKFHLNNRCGLVLQTAVLKFSEQLSNRTSLVEFSLVKGVRLKSLTLIKLHSAVDIFSEFYKIFGSAIFHNTHVLGPLKYLYSKFKIWYYYACFLSSYILLVKLRNFYQNMADKRMFNQFRAYVPIYFNTFQYSAQYIYTHKIF